MWQFIHKLSSPKYFYDITTKLSPWFVGAALLLFAYGLSGGLWFAPPDYQQGDGFRIIYVHIPCAVMSLAIYTFMAIAAAIGLIWRIKLAFMITRASAPVGATITLLALVTGAIWGKPMWGTYWIWDARLTSELILFFLYIGFIALQTALPDRQQAAKAGAILLLVGIVDIPIIHYSVDWWNTLHQGASLSLFAKPKIVNSMLYPLLAMMAAFACYLVWLILQRTRNEILFWQQQHRWIKNVKGIMS